MRKNYASSPGAPAVFTQHTSSAIFIDNYSKLSLG